VIGVELFSTGVALAVLGGVWSISVELIEPCDSASISLDVISSMPRNVVDDDVVVGGGGGIVVSGDVVEGGGGGIVVAGDVVEGGGGGTVVVAAAVAVVRDGLAVRSEADGGGVGERRKFDCTIC
jgi:hypothetical protein